MTSIRSTITMWISLGIAAVMILGGLSVFLTVRHKLAQRFDETLVAKADAIISGSEYEDGEIEIDFDIEGFAGFGSALGLDHFEIVHPDGRREAASPHLGDFRLAGDPLPPSGGRSFGKVRLPDGAPGRVVRLWFTPIDDNSGRPTEPVCLAVASGSRNLEQTIAILGAVLTFSTCVVAALAIPVVRFGLDRGLRPLARLGEEADALDAEGLDHRFDVEAMPDELVPVAGRLNDLLGRLDRSFDRERRFSSDAAHELRGPLTELRAIAELALGWPEHARPEQFVDIFDICMDMQKLVDHLLQLARAEGATGTLEKSPFEFAALIGETVDRLEDRAAARGVRLAVRVAPGPWTSDRMVWSLIARNLVGNAVGYAPSGADIAITGGPGWLTVGNPAPDLTPEDVRHFGERFWRKDGSRTDRGHTGLGLALVRAHVALLGGRFEVNLDETTAILSASVVEAAASDAATRAAPAQSADGEATRLPRGETVPRDEEKESMGRPRAGRPMLSELGVESPGGG